MDLPKLLLDYDITEGIPTVDQLADRLILPNSNMSVPVSLETKELYIEKKSSMLKALAFLSEDQKTNVRRGIFPLFYHVNESTEKLNLQPVIYLEGRNIPIKVDFKENSYIPSNKEISGDTIYVSYPYNFVVFDNAYTDFFISREKNLYNYYENKIAVLPNETDPNLNDKDTLFNKIDTLTHYFEYKFKFYQPYLEAIEDIKRLMNVVETNDYVTSIMTTHNTSFENDESRFLYWFELEIDKNTTKIITFTCEFDETWFDETIMPNRVVRIESMKVEQRIDYKENKRILTKDIINDLKKLYY
ncbi:MAG: hypothetical protein EZS28_044543 [Streblomastix strix]|uniref:Uncharacterized protein n=1 Tax=Streblomastix strix TaxID=222440 RepID=A0A5J4TPU2_9EUKA|nr:MAG: hypothetical protein EZS28_044543 [Streblomastix strix]